MWTKICGTTTLEDALLAAEAGADAVGFVFAASKRQVTPQQVAAITPHLPTGVARAGVFTSTDAGELLDATALAGLTHLQLHSAFQPALLETLRQRNAALQLMQVLDVAAATEPVELAAALRSALTHPAVSAVLLDTSHKGASGGTGVAFDWERYSAAVRAVEQETGGRIVIAGGLRPENVATAIEWFQPWGVDVVTGVEVVAGRKEPERVRAFVRAAKNAAPGT